VSPRDKEPPFLWGETGRNVRPPGTLLGLERQGAEDFSVVYKLTLHSSLVSKKSQAVREKIGGEGLPHSATYKSLPLG